MSKHIEIPQVVKDLNAAYELLLPEGSWCQGVGRDGPRRCAAQALCEVCDTDLDRYIIAVGKLIEHTGAPYQTITSWNDEEGRTHADVLQLLRDVMVKEVSKVVHEQRFQTE